MSEKVNFIEFGKRKKTLVFLHGWQQDGKSFLPIASFLAQKHRVILLDMPGFGKTPINKNLKNSYDYAYFIYKWIEERNLSNIVLIGHSFGGKVASLLAISHPQKIKGLILISPPVIPHPKFYYPLLPLLKKIPGIYFLKNLFLSSDYKNAGELAALFKEIVKEDIRKEIAKIKTPTLIIWGDKDKELPVSDGYLISKLIKRSKFEVVKNAGHFPFWDHPKQTSYLINKFIQKL